MLSEENFSKKIILVSFVSALFVVLIHAYWVNLSYTGYDDTAYKIALNMERFINFLGNFFEIIYL